MDYFLTNQIDKISNRNHRVVNRNVTCRKLNGPSASGSGTWPGRMSDGAIFKTANDMLPI